MDKRQQTRQEHDNNKALKFLTQLIQNIDNQIIKYKLVSNLNVSCQSINSQPILTFDL